MAKPESRELARKKRHQRLRVRVHGTAERPRLNVFRSLRHVYVQLIDDAAGHTMLSASSLDAEVSPIRPIPRPWALPWRYPYRGLPAGPQRSW